MTSESFNSAKKEFIILMAVLISLAALSIDAMLPALGQIAIDLNVQESNNVQLVISALFLGMSLGIILYGPLSDSFGRKKSLYMGISIFLLGTLISVFAPNLEIMLLGRAVQGFGVASCRVVAIAMIRDKFSGPEMGRVMSLIMAVFILVPALAPSLGQAILLFAEWHLIFWFIFAYGSIGLLWLHFRQTETLLIERRRVFSLKVIFSGIMETLKHPVSRGYTVASGFVFGAFVGYLSSAQQILQNHYKLGDLFAVYFGSLALALGASSYANSRIIALFGMEKICFFALTTFTTTSLLFFIYLLTSNGELGLNFFLFYLMITFFCFGLLFGNYNTLALQPFGHMAGIATSVISSIQMFLAVFIGGIIGQLYNGTVQPLIGGFLLCGFISMIIFMKIRKLS